MKKTLTAIVFLCAVLAALPARASDVPPDLKKAVVFLFVETPKGELRPSGTGFIVGVPNEVVPGGYFTYLVTARHAVEDEKGNLLPSLQVRLNDVRGEAVVLKFDVKPRAAYFHPDPSVDLAVFPINLDQKALDFRVVPEEMILSKDAFEKERVSEGDDVFVMGLLSQYYGQKKNLPVVRFGKMALVTDEKIDFMGGPQDLYLVECQSFGGNSGAPVFLSLASAAGPAMRVYLAGVMKGSFLDLREIAEKDAVSHERFSRESNGIAAVVPGYKILETLHSKDATAVRDGYLMMMAAKKQKEAISLEKKS